MSEIDEALPSARGLQQRLGFETLIADLSSRFTHLNAGAVDREIEAALRRVCEPLGVDLAVLGQCSSADPGIALVTHVYAREALQPPGPLRQEQFPWYAREMRAGRSVAVSSLDALPAAAAVDRESCRQIGVKSNLTLPLAVGQDPSMGILGFNTLQAERDWPDALVKRLQLVAQVFANALARQRYERRLLEGEARLAAGAELAGLGFYEADFDGGVVYTDERLRELLGVPADRQQGVQVIQFWAEQIHPDDRDHILDLRQQLYDGRLEGLDAEYRFVHPTQGDRWLHHLARVTRRDATGRTLKSFGVLRDITQTKRAEEALRELSGRLILAHEDERALLARELHDDVTQRLAMLAIEVGRAELAATEGKQAEVMRSVGEQLVRLSEDIHALAYQLHPSVLEELGLVEALRAEGERRRRQGRLAVSMDLESSSAAVSKDAHLCLFRVAQEALNNVVRHARTAAASVTLRQVDGGVLLAVRDDGAGFDPADPNPRRSLGLASMRERLHLVNGTLDIESAPGRGTTIVAWVPARAGDRHSA